MRPIHPRLAGLALILAACSSPAEPTAPAAPTPTLRPAPPYVEGHADALEGMYLFVEYFVVNGGTSTTGECPNATMIDFPGYSFSEGILRAEPGPLPIGEGIVGYAAFGTSNTGAAGGGTSSSVQPIAALPFPLPYDVVIIHTLAANGEVVAEIGDEEYLMGPGEAWVQVSEWDPTAGCHRTAVARFTNYGLLDESRIGSE